MKYLLSGLLAFSYCLSFGQAGQISNKLLNTKLLVILGEFPEFDEGIKKAFEKHWDINNYVFINKDEKKKYDDSTGYSYFGVGRADGATLNYYYFMVSLNKNMRLSNVRIAFNLKGDKSYFYKAEPIRNIAILRDYVKAMMDDKISNLTQFDNYINDDFDSKVLENKTLLVLESEVSKEDLYKCYPYKIKIVSSEDIYSAILSNDPNVIYFAQTITNISYNYLMDASTGKLIYIYQGLFKVNCSFLKKISNIKLKSK
jgi:hypothetical protein